MRNRALKQLGVFAVVALFSVPATSSEAGSTYAGGQFALLDFDLGFVDFEPTALVGRVGHFFVDNVAIEGRIGVGISDDSISAPGARLSVELENLFGVYLLGHLPIEGIVSPYGLIGFTSAKAKATFEDDFGRFSESDSESGFTWGLGVDVRVAQQVSLNAEYVRYLDKSDFDFSAVSLGVNYWF